MQRVSTQGWSFNTLLQQGERFRPVHRVSCTSEDLETQIKHYEESGVPFVIEGWHQNRHWPKEIFNMDFCLQYFQGKNKNINVRNVHARVDKSMAFAEFVEISRTTATFAEANETERWYGKDMECPQKWEEWLVKERSLLERHLPEGSHDLLSLRPKKNGRPDVETLMCYFGIGDTYTPCHKDLCASSGQNLMCYTEKGGSSFWFMTKSDDCVKVSQYFQRLKQELDHETYFISVPELANAPFDVFITEQKLGDLVLVPPRSCHQVLNYGGMTIKMSWSRMTLSGLSAALYHELPVYRRVCRPEIYQIKSTVYYALRKYTAQLDALNGRISSESVEKGVVSENLKTVLHLYDHILREEYSPSGTYFAPRRETFSLGLAEDFHTCDFCGADIFQNYFQCTGKSPHNAGETFFIVCPGCYVEGRTCACQKMEQKQRQNPDILFDVRWKALAALADAGESTAMFKGTDSPKEQKLFFSMVTFDSVFHVAMLLHQLRTRDIKTRNCRCSGSDRHAVPFAWGINCNKCHSSKCFPHLLSKSRMHSIHVLLLLDMDKTSATFHKAHNEKFSDYEERKAQLLASQAEGSTPPHSKTLLVYNSLTFNTCQPVNHEHASLGFYDRLLTSDFKSIVEPREGSTKSKDASITVDVDSEIRSATPRSFASDSQRSVKNLAYVELKSRQRSRRASGKLPLPDSSPLSSSECHSGCSELLNNGSDCSEGEGPSKKFTDYSASETAKGVLAGNGLDRHSAHLSSKKRQIIPGGGVSTPLNPSTKDGFSGTVIGGAHSIKSNRSMLGPILARGVKKPNFGDKSTNQPQSNKRSHHLTSDLGDDDTVFAPVFPIGPPNKKRRQNRELKSKEAVFDIARNGEPNEFATALGAAINQTAETATRTSDSVQRDGSVKQGTSKNDTVTGPSITRSHNPHRHQASQAQITPILVNVAELQSMVVRAANSVVQQMVGEIPPALLAAHAAVAMMTGYAAAGQFMDNNNQLQFPSLAHFAEAPSQVQTSTVSNKTNNNVNHNSHDGNNNIQLGTSSSSMIHQSLPMADTTMTVKPDLTQAVKEKGKAKGEDSHHHQRQQPQILKNVGGSGDGGEEAITSRRPKVHSEKSLKSRGSSTVYPEHRPSQPAPSIRRAVSGGSTAIERRKRGRIAEYDDSDNV